METLRMAGALKFQARIQARPRTLAPARAAADDLQRQDRAQARLRARAPVFEVLNLAALGFSPPGQRLFLTLHGWTIQSDSSQEDA